MNYEYKHYFISIYTVLLLFLTILQGGIYFMKGIIFDFNGTLFQDSDKHEAAWRQFALEQFGRKITDEEFIRNIHGRNNHAAVG